MKMLLTGQCINIGNKLIYNHIFPFYCYPQNQIFKGNFKLLGLGLNVP